MKKPEGNISHNRMKPFLWALIVSLSFFSSCTVRKGIQAHLDVPVTKQLNPSKAVTQQHYVCSFTDADVYAPVFSKKIIQDTALISIMNTNLFQQVTFLPGQEKNTLTGWPLTSKVDSYILFRQMKSWIHPSVS